MNQEKLFQTIEKISFTMDDLRLFLDTHPQDAEALAHYQKLQEMRRKAIMEYEEKYATLTGYGFATDQEWNWNKCPLPWL